MDTSGPIPPKIGRRILKILAKYEDSAALCGDFNEEYEWRAGTRGRFRAYLWFWCHLFKSLPHFFIDLFIWRMIMIRNYVNIALRAALHHRSYSFINVFGLAIGLAVCIFIFFWVQDELSYESCHDKSDRIYRILVETRRLSSYTAPKISEGLREFPEVEKASRFTIIRDRRQFLVKHGEQSHFEEKFGFADPALFEIFSLPFLKGDPDTALSHPQSIVITEDFAEKYFGGRDPMHKTLTINNEKDFLVTGVLKSLPRNSHLQFDSLIPFDHVEAYMPEYGRFLWSYGFHFFRNYMLVKENADIPALEKKVSKMLEVKNPNYPYKLHMQPLRRIHLHSRSIRDHVQRGDIRYVNFFIVIGILILTLAAINFVNLTTARAGIRAKEVGMRKVFGAVRRNLIYQFLSESTVFAAASLLLAAFLVFLAGPAFTSLTGKAIPWQLFHPLLILLSAGAVFLSLGILAGIYPAFYLSAFRPVRILKGTHAGEKGSGFFRRALVVFQFTFTIGLIVCAGVTHSQFQYIQKRDLGFDQENIVYTKLNGNLKTKSEALKLELLNNPLIGNVSAGSNILTSGAMGFSDFYWEGKPESDDLSRKLNFGHTNVDVNFVSMMNMTILEGRDFSAGRNPDAEILINQAAVREMGIESPVGLSAHIPDAEEDGTIIGVLKDYHFTSLHQTIRPLVISVNPNMFNYLYVELTPGDQFAALEHIREVCERIEPAFPCEIHFLDEELDNLYRSEKRMGSILNIFTGFALLVACLGLFGLASFTTERRTREIGIRKVLGATAAGILRMISREYMCLILLANFAAWPLSYLIMKRWLQGFAYRIDLNPWIFIYAAGLTLLVGLFSIGLKSYRAAAANPADSLRSE